MTNAWKFTEPLYRKSNKIPIKRTEFVHYADLLYMMGASNAVKDVYHYIKNSPKDDFDVIVGDLQLILQKAWNNMLENPIGAKTIKKMELEDILDEVHYRSILQKNPKK